MRHILIICITLFINIAQASQVLVTVDGKAITSVDLRKRLDALKTMYPDMAEDINVRKQILSNLVSEELFYNEADRLKITISDEEIDERLQEIQQEANLSPNIINSWKKNQAIRQQIKGQLMWNKLVSAVFYNKIKVSEAEIREEQKVRSLNIKEVSFKQLLFRNFEKEKIEAIRNEVTDCANFDSIAKKYGFHKPYFNTLIYQDLNPELQSIMRSLPVNRVSDLLQFNGQSQIIIICDKKVDSISIDPKFIKQELTAKKMNAEAQKYLAELKKRIYVEYVTPIE